MTLPARARFSRDGLQRSGFTGFQTVRELSRTGLAAVPCQPGVYTVLRTSAARPRFQVSSVGGWFKCKDPSVSRAILDAKWVDGAETVYIGRAAGGRGQLAARLGALVAFGLGLPVDHWGGRYLWQLPRSDRLVVCWKTADDARAFELELQQRFISTYGALPFANIRLGSARDKGAMSDGA